MNNQTRFQWSVSALLVIAGLATFGAFRARSAHASVGNDFAKFKATGADKSDADIARYEALIAKSPKNVEVYGKLGGAYMQKGRETGDLAMYCRARSAFEKAVEMGPKNKVSLHNYAWCLTIFHKFQDAISYANKAIKIDPNDADAWGVLSDSDFELGHYEKSLDEAQKMIDIRPNLASYSRGAAIRFIYGDIRGATWLMGRAIEAGGPYTENTAWCRVQLGDIYFKEGAVPAAEQQYAMVLRMVPNYRHALAGLARVRIAQKRFDEAEKMLLVANQGMPPIVYAVELGDLYTLMGRSNDAEAQFARIDPMIAEHLKFGIQGDDLKQAMFYLDHQRNLKNALEIAETAINDHASVEAYTTLAWAYYKNGRLSEGKKAIERAMAMKTQDALLFYRAGKIYAALGDMDRSRKLMLTATSLNPNFHPLFKSEALFAMK